MVYFDAIHAVTVHDEIINISGGLLGIMKEGQLESILDFVQNDDYYATLRISYLTFFSPLIKAIVLTMEIKDRQ